MIVGRKQSLFLLWNRGLTLAVSDMDRPSSSGVLADLSSQVVSEHSGQSSKSDCQVLSPTCGGGGQDLKHCTSYATKWKQSPLYTHVVAPGITLQNWTPQTFPLMCYGCFTDPANQLGHDCLSADATHTETLNIRTWNTIFEESNLKDIYKV